MDFYLTLPSNGGGLEFNPTNSNTAYKIRLPHRILLKDDDWEVAMVSISFPVRDHHKHYMLSSFPRGTIVAKIAAQSTFQSKREGTTTYGVEANVRIEDVKDPNTVTDVNPIKGGLSFTRHLVFAMQKAIDRKVIQTIKVDAYLTDGGYWDAGRRLRGLQTFTFTPDGSLTVSGDQTVNSPDVYFALHASLAEHMGLIAPGTAHVTNLEGRHIRAVSRGHANLPWKTEGVLNPFREVEYVDATAYILYRNQVEWHIIGLNDGWFEHVFNTKLHVLRILSNVCDSSVVGDVRTNVLAEALVNTAEKTGQDYYEPVHPRYVPVRQKELEIIEIRLDDLRGQLVNLGVGITSVVLHFKRAIKSG